MSSTKPSSSSSSHPSPPVSATNQRIRVIHEVFEPYNELGYKQALQQLDIALIERCDVIIIEPPRLSDETTRWIAVGNVLNHVSIWLGLAALGCHVIRVRVWLTAPLTIVSCLSFGIYFLSWRGDPCSEYRVERNPDELVRFLPGSNGAGDATGTSGSPVDRGANCGASNGRSPVVVLVHSTDRQLSDCTIWFPAIFVVGVAVVGVINWFKA